MQTREEQEPASEPFSATYKYRESPVYSSNAASARPEAYESQMTQMACNLMESFASLTEEIHAIRSPAASPSVSRLNAFKEVNVQSAMSFLQTGVDFGGLPLAVGRLDACVRRLEDRMVDLARLQRTGEAARYHTNSQKESAVQLEKRVCSEISALEGKSFESFDAYLGFLRERKEAYPQGFGSEALRNTNGELASAILRSYQMLRADAMLQELFSLKARLKMLKEQYELTDSLLSERLAGIQAALHQENALQSRRIAEMAAKARSDEQIIVLLRAELQASSKKQEMLLQHSQAMREEVQKAENERAQKLKSQVSEMQYSLALEQQMHADEIYAIGETMRQQRQFNEQCSRIIYLQQSQLRDSAASRTLSLTASFHAAGQAQGLYKSLRLEDM